jgi:hypothetical protein
MNPHSAAVDKTQLWSIFDASFCVGLDSICCYLFDVLENLIRAVVGTSDVNNHIDIDRANEVKICSRVFHGTVHWDDFFSSKLLGFLRSTDKLCQISSWSCQK